MKIALDAMGGDNAPRNIVEGAALAARETSSEIILVGDQKLVRDELDRVTRGRVPANISIHHASEIIGMGESPAVACKTKKDSSIMVCARLVKEQKASAFVSGGNTGAVMTASFLLLGRLEGIQRPGLPITMPHQFGVTVIIDAGANVDCRPSHLAQFAVMGEVYAEQILGVVRPRIGLLNVGEEDGKGGEIVQEAFGLIRSTRLNFIGNVEGRDLVNGRVDVVVCDGFTGNIILKFAEGMIHGIFGWLRDSYRESGLLAKLGGVLSKPAFRGIRGHLDPDRFGGMPLLGVNGTCIIGHGSAIPRAVSNSVKAAEKHIVQKVNSLIRERLRALGLARGGHG